MGIVPIGTVIVIITGSGGDKYRFLLFPLSRFFFGFCWKENLFHHSVFETPLTYHYHRIFGYQNLIVMVVCWCSFSHFIFFLRLPTFFFLIVLYTHIISVCIMVVGCFFSFSQFYSQSSSTTLIPLYFTFLKKRYFIVQHPIGSFVHKIWVFLLTHYVYVCVCLFVHSSSYFIIIIIGSVGWVWFGFFFRT